MAMITNVVSTADLNCSLNLKELAEKLEIKFDPRVFSGLTVRMSTPIKSHCQLYGNGKITVNGGVSVRESEELAKVYCETFKAMGYKDANVTNFKTVNVVAKWDLRKKVNLNNIFYEMKKWEKFVCYEPELFPGLSVRLDDVTAVVFHSGKVNILGAKTETQISTAELTLRRYFFP